MLEKELQADTKREKGFNSIVTLGTWILWKHRNSCVFQGAQPSMLNILQELRDEHHLWGLAGARELLSLEHNTNGV
jgi:hypothetical protein